MAWATTTCPVCGEELRIEVMEMEGGYPEEVLCEVTDIEQVCMCSLSDSQVEVLEEYAIEHADFTPQEDY
jgi:C4-type Zn-finger protein